MSSHVFDSVLFVCLLSSYLHLLSSYLYLLSGYLYLLASYLHLLASYLHLLASYLYLLSGYLHLLSGYLHLLSGYLHLLSDYLYLLSGYLHLLFGYLYLLSPPAVWLQEQSEAIWKYRDKLQNEVSTVAMRGLLEYNNQWVVNSESDLLARLSDAMVFGALSKCPECKEGQLVFK